MKSAAPPVVEAEGLAFGYASGGGLVRAGIRLEAGEVVAVEGTSGSGKSTLIALLGLILEPSGGTLRIAGTEVGGLSEGERDLMRRRSIGIVLQDLGLLSFLNAWENVAAAFGPRFARHQEESRALLRELGMEGLAHARVGELSGGQRQRVAVARAAVKRPVLVLADEPTSGLDPVNAAGVMGALRSCAGRGSAVLLVTHDQAVAAACDRRYALEDGVLDGVCEGGLV
ncbi:ABC transporter ATP-binding protein [Streptomyces sp. NPDC058486]|uniref:ABC transporter ATP-binding protein n=1 Tax=unclassified Streptomyces TaxID=2593676 RepID=UPI003668F339